jgi:hypothetical protein
VIDQLCNIPQFSTIQSYLAQKGVLFYLNQNAYIWLKSSEKFSERVKPKTKYH